MGNIDENLQRNNVARQVEGFCISYFTTLMHRTDTVETNTYKIFHIFRIFGLQICTVMLSDQAKLLPVKS